MSDLSVSSDLRNIRDRLKVIDEFVVAAARSAAAAESVARSCHALLVRLDCMATGTPIPDDHRDVTELLREAGIHEA